MLVHVTGMISVPFYLWFIYSFHLLGVTSVFLLSRCCLLRTRDVKRCFLINSVYTEPVSFLCGFI